MGAGVDGEIAGVVGDGRMEAYEWDGEVVLQKEAEARGDAAGEFAGGDGVRKGMGGRLAHTCEHNRGAGSGGGHTV
jgi:hypothetical protein